MRALPIRSGPGDRCGQWREQPVHRHLFRQNVDHTATPQRWNRIEVAKRRLVSALIGLGLPVKGTDENPTGGMAFDLLRTAPGAANVVTGHADGVITLNVEEADDALWGALCPLSRAWRRLRPGLRQR